MGQSSWHFIECPAYFSGGFGFDASSQYSITTLTNAPECEKIHCTLSWKQDFCGTQNSRIGLTGLVKMLQTYNSRIQTDTTHLLSAKKLFMGKQAKTRIMFVNAGKQQDTNMSSTIISWSKALKISKIKKDQRLVLRIRTSRSICHNLKKLGQIEENRLQYVYFCKFCSNMSYPDILSA